jgi:hypothetical protein
MLKDESARGVVRYGEILLKELEECGGCANQVEINVKGARVYISKLSTLS